MTKENDKHKKIRQNLYNRLKKLNGMKDLYSSHEKTGNVKFFRQGEDDIQLAEPDIVVIKDNHNIVVEIELSNSPKRLLGVAFAIYVSEYGKYAKEQEAMKIGNKSLLLILEYDNINKEESGKREQVREVRSLIKKQLKNFKYFNIVTERKAFEVIQSWIENKELEGDI